MVSFTFLKILSMAGLAGAVSIPAGAFLYDCFGNSINNFLKEGVVSPQTLKEHCYLLLSAAEINKKDLIVCEIKKYLSYYIVDRGGETVTVSEIDQVVSSSPGSYIGGDVIVELKKDKKKEPLSGVQEKNHVLSTLHILGKGGLKSKCKKIDGQVTKTWKLNCGNKLFIDLTRYEIRGDILSKSTR